MSDTRQFEGKVIVVTGAGTGMGADTAILLAERGAKVAIVGRREAPLRDIEAKILAAGGEALVISADMSKPEDATRVVAETVKHFGALHGAVNNAGIASENHDLPELPYELWDKTIGINLSSIFYCMRAQLPEIEKAGGGAIVNVSSVFADRGLPMRAAYSASKHGIRGITRSSALDWAARGVRINELQPGVIDTPMISQGGEKENEQIIAHIAAKRMGSGREIATAVAFLLSEDASYVVGAHLAVDGGFLA
jgi:NAD(P)-dependent dehydrogenase (short-subunit alcohol dehydrogenase family)